MDWNWFFSALPQSAAAFIGVIGAFIIAKMMNLNNDLKKELDEKKKYEIEFRELYKRNKNIEKIIKDYNRKSMILCDVIRNDIANGYTIKYDDKKKIRNYIYSKCPNLFFDEEVVTYFNEIKIKIHDIGFEANEIRKSEIINLQNNKLLIEDLKIKSERMIEIFKIKKENFRQLIKSYKSLKLIICYLILCTLINVIYPLHFLPIRGDINITFNLIGIIQNINLIQFIMLVIFFVTISSMFIYFLISIRQNIKIIESYINSIEKEKYEDIEKYSTYYKAIGVKPNLL